MKIDKKLYLLNYWNSGPSYNALTNAYLAELSAEGLSTPANTSALNTFIESVGSTILGKCDRLFTTLVGVDGQETVSLINPTANRATYPAGITVALNGWTGDAVADYVDLNLLASGGTNFLQNSGSLFVYTEVAPTTNDFLLGQNAFNGNQLRAASTTQQRINSNTNNASGLIDLTGTGFRGLTRVDATNISGYKDATKTDRTQTSVAPAAQNLSLFRQAATYTNGRISMVWVGGYLTEAEVTTLRTAYATFRTTMGV